MNLVKLIKTSSQKEMVTQPKKKTVKDIIEEIHDDFYTEADKLLADAKISRALSTDKQDLIDKHERLNKLGFCNAKEVKEAEIEIERIESLRLKNENNKTLTEAIEYFSVKYPCYKFITEKSVQKICNKYNLVYGKISRYTGCVPDKNLKHIELFSINEEDECFVEEMSSMMVPLGSEYIDKTYITKNEYDIRLNQEDRWGTYSSYYKCPLEIAAPMSDFDMKGMELKDFKIEEIPDPVVLKPVIFKKQKHYLIITAWGEEASDDIVVNEIDN